MLRNLIYNVETVKVLCYAFESQQKLVCDEIMKQKRGPYVVTVF